MDYPHSHTPSVMESSHLPPCWVTGWPLIDQLTINLCCNLLCSYMSIHFLFHTEFKHSVVAKKLYWQISIWLWQKKHSFPTSPMGKKNRVAAKIVSKSDRNRTNEKIRFYIENWNKIFSKSDQNRQKSGWTLKSISTRFRPFWNTIFHDYTRMGHDLSRFIGILKYRYAQWNSDHL